VVDDRVYSKGKLEERTHDYYTQDAGGNVWYFGEDTAELDAHGKVTSTEGTWRTGRNGARPGLFMPAHPRVGERHRQEYLRGHAEDQFQVVSLSDRVRVSYGSFTGALRTREWTPLEPRGGRQQGLRARGRPGPGARGPRRQREPATGQRQPRMTEVHSRTRCGSRRSRWSRA